ncbi:MAG: hypothetical protein ABUL60_35650 [Myxococcales bacterium]
MTQPDAELDLLFQDMARESALPEPVSSEARRRQRAIGGMHAMHRSLSEGRDRPRRRRYHLWLGVAAALAVVGTALAAARGGLHFALGPQTSESRESSGVAPKSPAAPVVPSLSPALVPALPPNPVAAPPPAASLARGNGRQPDSKPALTPSAELEEVNRLFVEAKRARREHRDAEALSLLQQLLTKHPRSVLTHEATVERFRTLARLGRTDDAERYARAYLARYPTGFAADEARSLLGASP